MDYEQRRQLADDAAKREFALELIAKIKLQNQQQGINLSQAMWTHHRLRDLECVFSSEFVANFPLVAALEGQTLKIDLLNLIVSGDLETAYVALLACIPDDGTEPYHWLTQEKLTSIINEIGTFLGWE